jgi:acylphosphatase
MTRYSVHFTGRVQGVGFRYAAREIAAGYPVTGFVRNLDDGRVHLVAEGEEAQLEAFLSELRRRMAGHIREASVTREASTGEFGPPADGAFTIRH